MHKPFKLNNYKSQLVKSEFKLRCTAYEVYSTSSINVLQNFGEMHYVNKQVYKGDKLTIEN